MSKHNFDPQYIGTESVGNGPNIGYNVRKWAHELNNGLNGLSGKQSMDKRARELKSSPNGDYRRGSSKGHGNTPASKNNSGLSKQYINQNIIGIDQQPLDPDFHVFRPINMRAIATHPDMAAADIIELSGGKYGQAQAWDLISAMIRNSNGGQSRKPSCSGVISKSQYYHILRSVSPYRSNREVALSLATGKSSFPSTPNTPLGDLAPYQTALTDYMQNREYKYECRLFNFYADDSKYFSGTITLTGRIGMEFGKRVVWFDQRRRYAWEFYLTGVSHDFSWQKGWTTTITVERGLPFTFKEAETYLTDQTTGDDWLRDTEVPVANGQIQPDVGKPILGDFNKRFTSSMWGHAEPFVGGFFGEQTLASMLSQANAREQAYMTKFTGGGTSSNGGTSQGGSSSDIAAYAKSQIGKHPYAYNPSTRNEIVKENGKTGSHADCSSFAFWCCKHCGYKAVFRGNAWTTNSGIMDDCKKINPSSAKAGDIVCSAIHAMVVVGPYKGLDTKIVAEGGSGTDKYNGNNVGPGTVGLADYSRSFTWYRPQKA